MGRWVTSKGRRIYIPDEGEEIPEKYQKNVDKNFTNKKTPESVTDAKTHKDLVDKLDKSGLKLDSADAHSMQHASYFNDTKVTMYDDDGNEYQGTYNKYSDGGREIVNIEKTKEGKKQSSTSKTKTINDRLKEDAEKFRKDPNVAAREGWGNGYYQEVKEYMNQQKDTVKEAISKNEDLKEKQIAKNKKQRDSLNSKGVSLEQKKQYLRDNNLTRFAKELNSSGSNEKGAVEYVYDQHTLSKEEFRKKYFGNTDKKKKKK